MLSSTKTLSSALAVVFGRLDLPIKELLGGPLQYTDLDWQVPPIRSDEVLNGQPFWQYMEQRVKIDEEVLYSFWCDTLYDMRNNATRVWVNGAYREARTTFSLSRAVGAYCLSFPDGAPAHATDYAGITFSLECANLLRMAGGVPELFESDNDYYVKTVSGYEVGVRDGLPIVAFEEWDTSAKGLVREILYQPRGPIVTTCSYDIIAKMRSILWEHRDSVPEFEGADLALQALRVLEGANDLLRAVSNIKENKSKVNGRAATIRSALDVLQAPSLSDRQKLTAVRDMLVPAAMSKATFSKLLYSYTAEFPAMLPLPKMLKITSRVEDLLRIDEALYRPKS